MGEVDIESHKVDVTFYRLTSLSSMSIGHPIPEIRLFQNLTLKIQGQGHGWGERWQSQSGCSILSIHIPFVPCQSALPILRYSIFKIWPWKSKVKVKWPWCCTTTYGANGQITMRLHNYRSRQVHETLNGVNPSSSFRDMRSAKSGPNLWQIWQVFGPWASPYGANGHMTMTVHTYRPRQFHRTLNGENPSSGYRDMGSASLAAARPPAHPPGPWRQYPSSPEGWGVKKGIATQITLV